MVKLLITILMSVGLNFFNIITTPINVIVTQYFPDIEDYIQTILNSLQIYVFPIVGWFFNLLPLPILNALLLYFNTYLLINWYFEPIYKAIVRGLNLIKKLPFM